MERNYQAFFSCFWEAVAIVTILVSVGSYYTPYYLLYFVLSTILLVSLLEVYRYETKTKHNKECVAATIDQQQKQNVVNFKKKSYSKGVKKRNKFHSAIIDATRRNTFSPTSSNCSFQQLICSNNNINNINNNSTNINNNSNNNITYNAEVDSSTPDLMKVSRSSTGQKSASSYRLSCSSSGSSNGGFPQKVTLRSKIKSKIDKVREKRVRASLPETILMKHAKEIEEK